MCGGSNESLLLCLVRQWWELDSDHDFLVSKNDLLRYGNHSLTYRIVERIFTQVPPRPGPLMLLAAGSFVCGQDIKSSVSFVKQWEYVFHAGKVHTEAHLGSLRRR